MREKILKSLAKIHTHHPWRMLVIVAVLTIIFLALASNLKITMRWSDLLPSKDRRTISFNKIINEFVSATSIVVVIQGEEERIKAFAEDVVPKIMLTADPKDKKPFIRRIDYKQEIEFIKNHGLMLIRWHPKLNKHNAALRRGRSSRRISCAKSPECCSTGC